MHIAKILPKSVLLRERLSVRGKEIIVGWNPLWGEICRGGHLASWGEIRVIPITHFLLHPLASLYSRRHEYEADAYAAAHSDARDLMHALVKLYQDNAATLTPDPLHSAFYDSHPPAVLRIARLQALSH